MLMKTDEHYFMYTQTLRVWCNLINYVESLRLDYPDLPTKYPKLTFTFEENIRFYWGVELGTYYSQTNTSTLNKDCIYIMAIHLRNQYSKDVDVPDPVLDDIKDRTYLKKYLNIIYDKKLRIN